MQFGHIEPELCRFVFRTSYIGWGKQNGGQLKVFCEQGAERRGSEQWGAASCEQVCASLPLDMSNSSLYSRYTSKMVTEVFQSRRFN
jgi:hypothetical protein